MSSIIKVDTIQKADGTACTIENLGLATGALSHRNIIINGAMEICQRYGEANPQNTTGGWNHVDRFGMYYSGNSYTTQQSTTAPDGFLHSLKLTVDGTTTPTYSFFGQRVEGLNAAHLGFGKSWAKTITISFWVRSSVTGVYSIAVTNGAGDRAYAIQYTINTANTWEQKTTTIAGDTTGTWLVNNANGFYLRFNMGSPSGRLISAGSWQAANADGATGSTGADIWATTSGATFYLTGVQVELGSVATPFEHRSYGEELTRCERYYQILGGVSQSGTGMITVTGWDANNAYGVYRFPTEMRTSPSLYTNNLPRIYMNGSSVTLSTIGLNSAESNTKGCRIGMSISSGSNIGANRSGWLQGTSGNNTEIQFDAEL